MGTRGAVGFVHNDTIKSFYNHFDSYPSGIGENILRWLRSVVDQDRVDEIAAKVDALQHVDEMDQPTVDQIAQLDTNLASVGTSLAGLWDSGLSGGNDWYATLRNAQGSPELMLGAGFYSEYGDFFQDSLFCEWGYVIDLDNRILEVYQGFQREQHTKGRFASATATNGYFPVALIASYPFSELPANFSDLEPSDDE